MLSVALVYGAIAGLVAIGAIILSLVLGDQQHAAGSEWLGYLVMLLALTLIFFGIKRHRDRDLGGVIRFLPALLAGLAIAAVASLIYTLVWEVYLAASGTDFIGDYTAAILAEKRAAGLSGAALEAEALALEQMRARYANPLFRLPVTFLEIFPVGILVALVSAALLRNPGFAAARQP